MGAADARRFGFAAFVGEEMNWLLVTRRWLLKAKSSNQQQATSNEQQVNRK
jgi:hypothetical protein